jgi:hypothetical protein
MASLPQNARVTTEGVAQMLGQQAARLKYLAESFRIPVLVTNQVTTAFGSASERGADFAFQQVDAEGAASASQRGRRLESQLVAALGTKWAHCVNTRLLLEAAEGGRWVTVAKSAGASHRTVPYAVTPAGIMEVELALGDSGAYVGQSGGDVQRMSIRNQPADTMGSGFT